MILGLVCKVNAEKMAGKRKKSCFAVEKLMLI